MPQIAQAVATWIFNTLVTIGVSKGVALVLTNVAMFALKTAAIAGAMRALTPKPPSGSIDQGQELRIKFDSAYPREVVVGRGAVGGTLEYATTSGTDNKFLWRVVQLSDVEIDAVEEIWANGEKLTFSGDWHTGYATCTSHFQSTSGADRLSVRIYKGTASQTADADLIAAAPSGEWDSTCRGRGLAYAITKMEYDTDAFKTGEPELFYVVRGAKVADPRTDVTAWSENLALIAGQALKGFRNNGVRVVGLGAVDADVPDAELEDAADICDELVARAVGGDEKRYAGGGTISGSETARDILTNLVAGMAGQHIDRGGQIVLLPGAPRPVILALTDDDMLADAPITYVGKRSAAELVNAISSTHVSPADAWQEAALPPRKDAAAITADGERYETQRAYRYVTSRTHGQRLDEIELRKARKQGRGSFSIGMWGIELEPGDWFTWTSRRFGSGLQTKTFFVETTEIAVSGGDSPTARIGISCVEIDASVFAWSTADEITNGVLTVARTVPAFALSGFTLAAATVTAGGASMPELRASWTAINNPAADWVDIEYRRSDATSVVYRAVAPASDTAIALREGVYADKTYEARARIRAGEQVGAWTAWDSEATGAIGALGLQHWATMPTNSQIGVAGARSQIALSSSSSSSISVAAHTLDLPGQQLSLPSATLSGLSTDTAYWVFYDRTAAAYVATATQATAAGYYADATGRYVAVGNQRTQTGGGGFTPPPPPPPGYGGGDGGTYLN